MANPSILLISEDVKFAEQADTVLSEMGYYVRVAPDARRGLSMALGYPPNLIVLDYDLEDKDGLTLLADIRASDELEKVPVVMTSSSGRSELVSRAIKLHVSGFLVRPFDLTALSEGSLRLLP
jgi:DNA-binding response OmpR family regulator